MWHGLYAPRGTPKATVERLTAALQRALRDPALVQRFAQLAAVSLDATRMSPQAPQVHLRSEMDRWGTMIRKAGISAD